MFAVRHDLAVAFHDPAERQVSRSIPCLPSTETLGQPRGVDGAAGAETALNSMVYSRGEIERVCRMAFELARNRRGKLTSVDKANVLENSQLWRRVVNQMAAEYPDIELEHMLVDNCAMQLLLRPTAFDVVVTENLFGDIITDIGAIISGGLGIAAGGNINPEGVSMFEPIGGSAPKYTGQGVINPLAAINAMHMLLDHLGESDASARVEGALVSALQSGKIKSMSAGRMGMGTAEVGDLVASLV